MWMLRFIKKAAKGFGKVAEILTGTQHGIANRRNFSSAESKSLDHGTGNRRTLHVHSRHVTGHHGGEAPTFRRNEGRFNRQVLPAPVVFMPDASDDSSLF